MRYEYDFDGTGDGDEQEHFLLRSPRGKPIRVYGSVLWVNVWLSEKDAAAYVGRYGSELKKAVDASWFAMVWVEADEEEKDQDNAGDPQVCLIIRPGIWGDGPQTNDADAIAERAVHHLGRLLRGEV